MHKLIDFLKNRMKPTELYQPAVIKELLMHDGQRTKSQLAAALAQYDLSVQKYYEHIVMRYPKDTLTKHSIVDFQRSGSLFRLLAYPDDADLRAEAISLCELKISEKCESKRNRDKTPKVGTSLRYEILKESGGRCTLCGVPASLRPIDIDHIVPRSKADKNGKVRKNGRLIDLNSRENLQALCFSCNRGKRDADTTDFRRTRKLVRDRVPSLIESEGGSAPVKVLTGRALKKALHEKLIEEHTELITAADPDARTEEMADMIEVLFALAREIQIDQVQLLNVVERKRKEKGGFTEGFLLQAN